MTMRTPGLRSEAVRRSNLSTILRTIHLVGPLSRSELGTRTGLTRSAVGTLVSELTASGYVREVKARSDGTPGRPSPLVEPQSGSKAMLAVDVLVDSVAVAAIGLGGAVLRSARRDRGRDRISADRTVSDVSQLAAGVLASLPAGCTLLGMGVSVPGLVRRSDQLVVVAPNLEWHGVPFGDLLLESLELDLPYQVGNDSDLGALAESHRGVAAGLDDVLYLSAEVGIGGGMIVAGGLVDGQSGFAGEIGHVPLNLDGVRCSCGSIGCIETEVGEEALLRRTGRPVDGGRSALAEVLEAADDGDEDVLAALREHGRWLGIGLSGLINVLNPQAVVLGGILGQAHPHLVATMEVELDRRVLAPIRSETRVLASTLGGDASLIGAGELAWDDALDRAVFAADG